MLILAIETSTSESEVAVLEDFQVISSHRLSGGQRSASQLSPEIARVLGDAGCSPQQIELVGLSIGPGSFTGLRIGCVTAKVWGYATAAPVVAVPTHAVIARQGLMGHRETTGADGEKPRWVQVVTDAQRQELFASIWEWNGQDLVPHAEPKIVDRASWMDSLTAGSLCCGTGLQPLLERIPWTVEVVPSKFWSPTAEMVGRLALGEFQAGVRSDIWSLSPLYLRLSAAEEKSLGR